MFKYLCVAATVIALFAASFVAAQPIPVRGVIEGFYGQPWSHAQRVNFFRFCKQHSLNAYIYAPKDDPYHRAKWREHYPSDQLNHLRDLISAANQNGVTFIFAVSPGLDINYSALDVNTMITKLNSVYDLGCRQFAIFFDDIDDKNAIAQANFLNRINRFFVSKHFDVKPLITVPTEYFRLDMTNDDGSLKPYTREFSAALDDNILVLYTGDGVVCPNITDDQFNSVNRIYNRKVGVWWNYPVNDYMPQKLALGPVEPFPDDMPAVFFNPMSAYELSKISLATAADFALQPENYDPQISWNNAIEQLFGNQASGMKVFAQHSQHMQNSWANCGRDDAPELRAEFDRLLNGENRSKAVNNILFNHINAVRALKENLPQNILVECQPQLDQLERILQADVIAVHLLQSNSLQLKSLLKEKLAEIDQQSDKALISETCAYQFIIDVLQR